jgi:hypothetical protein
MELADPVGAVEVGERQDVEELRTGSGIEGVEALAQDSFETWYEVTRTANCSPRL